MKKQNKPKLFDNKRLLLLFAFLLSVLAWIVVAGFINPGSTRTISNVRIDYTRSETVYQNRNLQIVSDQTGQAYADVLVSGDNSLITGLSSTDITVYPDYSAVTGPGEHVVPIKTEKVTQGNYNITDYSLKNSSHSLRSNSVTTVTIEFEEVESKEMTVSVKADNITAASGFFKDTAYALPETVTITGPKSEVARVSSVVAEIPHEEARQETIIFTGVELMLYDASGERVDSERLEITPGNTVEVNIPILEAQAISLKLDYTGVPQGFDIEWLDSLVTLSTDTLQVVGSSAALNNLSNPYPVHTVDLSQLELGWAPEPFNIELPEGLRSLEQVRQVVATLDSSELVEKSFDVSDINVINTPRNATVEPVAEYISNVTLIGPADQINALLPENITIEVDAFDLVATKSGQQTLPARVLIPSANRVFASGSYPVVCEVTVDVEPADDSGS